MLSGIRIIDDDFLEDMGRMQLTKKEGKKPPSKDVLREKGDSFITLNYQDFTNYLSEMKSGLREDPQLPLLVKIPIIDAEGQRILDYQGKQMFGLLSITSREEFIQRRKEYAPFIRNKPILIPQTSGKDSNVLPGTIASLYKEWNQAFGENFTRTFFEKFYSFFWEGTILPSGEILDEMSELLLERKNLLDLTSSWKGSELFALEKRDSIRPLDTFSTSNFDVVLAFAKKLLAWEKKAQLLKRRHFYLSVMLGTKSTNTSSDEKIKEYNSFKVIASQLDEIREQIFPKKDLAIPSSKMLSESIDKSENRVSMRIEKSAAKRAISKGRKLIDATSNEPKVFCYMDGSWAKGDACFYVLDLQKVEKVSKRTKIVKGVSIDQIKDFLNGKDPKKKLLDSGAYRMCTFKNGSLHSNENGNIRIYKVDYENVKWIADLDFASQERSRLVKNKDTKTLKWVVKKEKDTIDKTTKARVRTAEIHLQIATLLIRSLIKDLFNGDLDTYDMNCFNNMNSFLHEVERSDLRFYYEKDPIFQCLFAIWKEIKEPVYSILLEKTALEDTEKKIVKTDGEIQPFSAKKEKKKIVNVRELFETFLLWKKSLDIFLDVADKDIYSYYIPIAKEMIPLIDSYLEKFPLEWRELAQKKWVELEETDKKSYESKSSPFPLEFQLSNRKGVWKNSLLNTIETNEQEKIKNNPDQLRENNKVYQRVILSLLETIDSLVSKALTASVYSGSSSLEGVIGTLTNKRAFIDAFSPTFQMATRPKDIVADAANAYPEKSQEYVEYLDTMIALKKNAHKMSFDREEEKSRLRENHPDILKFFGFKK